MQAFFEAAEGIRTLDLLLASKACGVKSRDVV
jgi:hypothetical protein